MTDKELLTYCKETYSSGSFSGNEIVKELKLTNIVHAQLKRLVIKAELGSYARDEYIYYFIENNKTKIL